MIARLLDGAQILARLHREDVLSDAGDNEIPEKTTMPAAAQFPPESAITRDMRHIRQKRTTTGRRPLVRLHYLVGLHEGLRELIEGVSP